MNKVSILVTKQQSTMMTLMNILQQAQLLKKTTPQALKLWSQIIVSSKKELLTIFIATQVFAQYFLYTLNKYPYFENAKTYFNLSSYFLLVIEAIFLLILIPQRAQELTLDKPKLPYLTHFHREFMTLFTEGLQMIAYIILWCLLIIIPGLFKQVRWSFMPFIVQIDPDYQKNNIDPLELSNKLIKGITFVIALIIATDFIIQQTIDSFALTLSSPLQFLGLFSSGLLTLGVSIYTYCLFFTIYKHRMSTIKTTEE